MGLFDKQNPAVEALAARVAALEATLADQASQLRVLNEELEDARSQGRRIADIAEVLTTRLVGSGTIADIQAEADELATE